MTIKNSPTAGLQLTVVHQNGAPSVNGYVHDIEVEITNIGSTPFVGKIVIASGANGHFYVHTHIGFQNHGPFGILNPGKSFRYKLEEPFKVTEIELSAGP
jgi:hypothetical protein